MRSSGLPIKTEKNPALIQLENSKQVLLLQGPVGPFFDRLTVWLQRKETQVHRIAFQGGDLFDSKALKPMLYQGTLKEWPNYLAATIKQLQIDCLVMFGQSRKYHERARSYANSIGLPLVVLEEGYFRPGYITMELGGVNGYSSTLEKYQWQKSATHTVSGIQSDVARWHFQSMAIHASLHYIAMQRDTDKFPDYEHHRNNNPTHYAFYWLRSWYRKIRLSRIDYRFQKKLFSNNQPYFFVPLQYDDDAQITHHSSFGKNANFITRVMQSFAQNSAADSWLVFRHHPHSRGGNGHAELISKLASDLGMRYRVHHMTEGDTPDLAQRSLGVVLINSTVGLQAIERGAPLMVMGDALYKRDGVSFGGNLDDFWRQACAPRKKTAFNFLSQIKNLTQAPASVYAKFDQPLRW